MAETKAFEDLRANLANKTDVRLFVINLIEQAGVVITQRPSISVNPSTHPRFSADSEWVRQAEWLADRFTKPLGLESRHQYMDRLPKFPEQPTEDVDIPVLVQAAVLSEGLTRVKILDILEVGCDQDVIEEFKDWKDDPAMFQTPELYATYVDDGSNHLGEKPEDVRVWLKGEEHWRTYRMGNDYEGIYLARSVYPAVLNHHNLDLTGTQYGSGDGAHLSRGGTEPWLRCRSVDRVGPLWGSVLAGRNINVGTLFP